MQPLFRDSAQLNCPLIPFAGDAPPPSATRLGHPRFSTVRVCRSFFPNNLYTRRSAFRRQILTRTFKQRPFSPVEKITRTRWRPGYFLFFFFLVFTFRSLHAKRFDLIMHPHRWIIFVRPRSSIPRSTRTNARALLLLSSTVTCQDSARTFRIEPLCSQRRKDVNCEQRGFQRRRRA